MDGINLKLSDKSSRDSSEMSACIKSMIQDEPSFCSSLSFSSVENLSIDIGELSIDDPSTKYVMNSSQVSSSPHEDFHLPSNISKIEDGLCNISISYSISFDEDSEAPVYSSNTKRKLKSVPRHSMGSSNISKYSPLAKNILNINSTEKTQKRYSDFFRNELCNLGLSIDKKSLQSLSDDEISFNGTDTRLSIDSTSSNINSFSPNSFNVTDKKLSIDSVSPNMSYFSPNGSSNQVSLNLSIDSDLDNVKHFSTEEDIQQINSNQFSLDDNKENNISNLNDSTLNITNHIKSKGHILLSSDGEDSDEDIKTAGRVKSKTHILVSSDEDEESQNDDLNYFYNEENDMDSFIVDDDVVEYEEGADVDLEDGDISECSSLDDSCSESDNSDDSFLTTCTSIVPESKPSVYHTPKSNIRSKSNHVPNIFKTPTTTCYPTAKNTESNNRRRTGIATPLSVKSKIGTPATPNRTFNRNFVRAAAELFEQFNENVFGNQLPADLEIKLNKRLNTTAGRCVYLRKGEARRVYIELSPKVVDCLERLKETLAHEMCHAATFLIDKKMDNHGPVWRKWAKRVNDKYPELPPVSRCHSYEINYKYTYRCCESWCTYKIGRYTRSIDLERARCPLCFSRLVLPETEASSIKAPNKWTSFVKSNFNRVKMDNPPLTPHKDLMKLLSKEFNELKVYQSA